MSNVVDRKKAKRLFLRAVELIAQTGALFVPRYLQLFFEYAEGSNRALNDAIGEMLRSSPKPSPSELDMLFELHLTDLAECQDFSGMGERLGEEVRDALEVVREAVSSTSNFGDSVKKAETQLGDFSDPEKVKSAIASLVQATRQMSRHNAEMNSRLTASADQIEQLQSDLDKVRLDSQTDSLTGVANRKCFDQTLAKEIADAEKQAKPLSLCMVDVDHFKKFNDKYGHRAGDSALRFVASIFQHSVRDHDLVARYGGEEFSVIMPNADLAVGVRVADRIRETLSAKELIKRSSGKSLGNVTASIGVAQLRENDTPETLIERADRALYEAKRAGRNRVQPESGEPADQYQSAQCVA